MRIQIVPIVLAALFEMAASVTVQDLLERNKSVAVLSQSASTNRSQAVCGLACTLSQPQRGRFSGKLAWYCYGYVPRSMRLGENLEADAFSVVRRFPSSA